jgi:hypothetical protein
MADKDRAREALEDAVMRAREAGMTADEVKTEVDYALETFEDDG